MGRKILVRSDSSVYHISARTNNKECFPLPISDCWRLYCHYLKELQDQYNFKIHAFVLMSNHFHLLCSTPDSNIDLGMRSFMSQTSKGIGMASEKINHLYGGRYHWTEIKDPLHYAIAYKYIYRNPIRAKICSDIRDYIWSTSVQLNTGFAILPHDLDYFIPKCQLHLWLNECKNFDEHTFKKSFYRKLFYIPKDRSTREVVGVNSYIHIDADALPKGD